MYFGGIGRETSAPVYDRYLLSPGDRFSGPAIVEERESTFVIGPGAEAAVDELANLVVRYARDGR